MTTLLTITSEDSLTSLGSTFVTSFLRGFSVSETWPLATSWQYTGSCLVRSVTSFLRPFLIVGEDWTRELCEATAAGGCGLADDVSRVGCIDASLPKGFITLRWDVVSFSGRIGGMLKQNIHAYINSNWKIIIINKRPSTVKLTHMWECLHRTATVGCLHTITNHKCYIQSTTKLTY